MVDHERIWLEPEPNSDPYEGRQWCQHNVWGDEATEYVRADLEAALASPAEVGEPVAWMRHNPGFLDRPTANPPSEADRAKGITASPLYLHPPQQESARLREEIERLEKALETAREDAIEAAAKVAESEPELEGEPAPNVMSAMLAIGPVGNARASVRATKASIASRIRALSLSQKKEG